MEENFIRIATLIGDPARAAMLWNLLDGRAYTAGELALCADLSPSAASNHLTKLVNEGLLTMERQSRHKYFRFANAQVAGVIETMGALASRYSLTDPAQAARQQGLHYCRKCYDHLAGQVGVGLMVSLLDQQYLTSQGQVFSVTDQGKDWLIGFGIDLAGLAASRRPLARPCLDWSERKAHLAGSIGQALFDRFVALDWLRPTQGSRAVVVTSMGRQQLSDQFKMLI